MGKLEWDELSPEQQNGFIALIKGLNDGKFPEPKQQEKWTVERVRNTVKAEHFIDKSGNLSNTTYYKGEINNVPTSNDALKVLAFCQLLTCAHWANDLDMDYWDFWTWKHSGNEYPVPIVFSENSFNKFLSIEGIEPLLKTFFGID